MDRYDKIYADVRGYQHSFEKRLSAMAKPIFENFPICDGSMLLNASYAAAELSFAFMCSFEFPRMRAATRISVRKFIRDEFEEASIDYGEALQKIAVVMAVHMADLTAERIRHEMEEAYAAGDAERARKVALEALGDEELLRETELLAEDYLDMLEPEEAFARAVAEEYVSIAEEFDN